MSSIIVPEGAQPSDDAFAPLPTADELAAQQHAQPADPDPTPEPKKVEDDFELPGKFEGKSVREIVESYTNLEAELGRKAQEVGTLRGLTDQLLELKRTEDLTQHGGQPAPQSEVTADDLLNDPQGAITGVAQAATSETNSRVDKLEHELAMRDFHAKHPTFIEDQTDPDFQAFVQGSAYRQGLAAKAVSQDLIAADELWTAWEEVKASRTAATEQDPEPKQEQEEAEEAATAIASRGGESIGDQPAKAISREALIRKRIEDPEGYYDPAFQEYMTNMYKRGLVK